MVASGLEPLQQESTPALIARKLRTAIGNGEFAPGTQLGEADLAGRLGVSRGPLREAMQRLTQEGLLVGIRNRGLFVAEFSQADITDIHLTRTAIERGAALKIIEVGNSHREAGRELLGLVEQMEGLGEDAEAVARMDMTFHETLVRMAGSPRLARVHATLMTETSMFLSTWEGTAYPLAERVAEHRRIARAILDADVPELHRALAGHMDSAVARLLGPGMSMGTTGITGV